MEQERRKLLTVAEAAAALGISIKTVRRWADRGMLAHVRTPTGYRMFDPDVIEDLQRQMQVPEGKAAA